MTLTNFPNGITSFGVPVMGSGFPITTGNYFFVSSVVGNDDYNGTEPELAVATKESALAKCTAGNADVIILMPGHAENVTSAGGLTCDVAGVTTIGIGNGSLKPKFTLTETASTIVISASNLTFHNVAFEAGKAEVAIGLDVSAIGGLTFIDCEFTEASSMNYVQVIDLATGSSNLTLKGCKFIGGDTNNDSFINGVVHDGLYIDNCYFASNVAQATAAGLIYTSGNVTNVLITNSYFRSNIDNAVFIDLNGTANGGLITNCYFSSIDAAGAVTACIDFTGGHVFECYVAGDADSFGIVGGGTVYSN